MSPRGAAAAFGAMPLTLKGVASFFAVFGLGSLLLAALPGLEHRMADRTFGPGEFWRSGHGVWAFALGAWLSLAALGLLRRTRWARVAVAGASLPLVVGDAWLSPTSPGPGTIACALAWAAGSALYLQRAPGARAYFSAAPD